MKGKKATVYAGFIVLTEAVGALAGWLTRDAMKLYEATVAKPPLSPPGWVFPVVWTILYALMAIGAARVFLTPHSGRRTLALTLFFVQLGVNFLWPILFFSLGWFAAGFMWLVALWALVLWMMAIFEELDKPASRLQTPYLLWLTFAAYLNFGVWMLNR